MKSFLCVQAPDCCVVGIGEKILLFRHQPASEQLLLHLADHDELQHGDLIEVIIPGQWSKEQGGIIFVSVHRGDGKCPVWTFLVICLIFREVEVLCRRELSEILKHICSDTVSPHLFISSR